MKRDMDLIRDLLFLLEDRSEDCVLEVDSFSGYSKAEVQYHLNLMYEAGFISAEPARSSTSDRIILVLPFGLTWQGHEFLDAIRDDSIYEKVKSKIKAIGGKAGFEVIKTLAVQLALRVLTNGT